MRDINLVVAVGNYPICDPDSTCSASDTCLSSPADFLDYSLAVAGVTCHGDTLEGWVPMRGSWIDLTAPGGHGMYRPCSASDSCYANNVNGTSFAAPLVSGIIALLLGADPDMTNEDCYRLLEVTASEMEGSPMSDPILGGHGLVRAASALSLITDPWELKHGSVISYSADSVGKGWREWMNVPGFNSEDETWDSVWVHVYRLTSTVDLTDAAYDSIGHVWARPRHSSGWKDIPKFDWKLHVGGAELLGWREQTEVASFGTYTFLAFSDKTETDTLGWWPTTLTRGPWGISYSYLVKYPEDKLGAAPPATGESILRFGPATTLSRADELPFRFVLSRSGSYSLAIYDVEGRVVRKLLDEARFGAGKHEVVWDRKDTKGRSASAGVYFAKMWRVKDGKQEGARTARLVVVR